MLKHSIVLPKCDNNGKRNDVSMRLLQRIVGNASKRFGGCSVIEGSGYWVMQTGELKRDEWYRIEVLSDTPEADVFMTECSSEIKRDLDQESVLVSKETCDVQFV